MKNVRYLILGALLLAFAIPAAFAADTDPQTPAPIQHGPRFVDENGDGFNDLAPDHDGDGIPNGQDADWTRPQDGSGAQSGLRGRGMGRRSGLGGGQGFVDADGDGICDNYGQGLRTGQGYGPRARCQAGCGKGLRGSLRGGGASGSPK